MSGSAHKLRSDAAAPTTASGLPQARENEITGVQARPPRQSVQLPSLGDSTSPAPDQAEVGVPQAPGKPSTKRRRKLGPARAEAKARTREAILDAACALFSEEGFDQPGLDTICSVAGRTRGAYNVHFRSREHLITTVALRAIQRLEDRVARQQQHASNPPLGFLLSPMDEEHLPPMLLLHAAARYPEVQAAYVAALQRMGQQLTDSLDAQVAGGKLRHDANPAQTALMLTALLTGLDTLERLGLGAARGTGATIAASPSQRAAEAPTRAQLVDLLGVLLRRSQ